MKTILIAFQSDTAFLLAQNKQAKIVVNKDSSIYWKSESLTQDGAIKATHYANALAEASNKKIAIAIPNAYGRTIFNNNYLWCRATQPESIQMKNTYCAFYQNTNYHYNKKCSGKSFYFDDKLSLLH